MQPIQQMVEILYFQQLLLQVVEEDLVKLVLLRVVDLAVAVVQQGQALESLHQ